MKKIFLMLICSCITVQTYAWDLFGEKKETDKHIHKETLHKVRPFNLQQLNANTISYIYVGPKRHQCFAPIIKPQYATVSSLATKKQYTDGMGIAGFSSTAITDKELNQLYTAILNKDKETAFKVFNIMFARVNQDNVNIVYYGKDSENRNTIYIYKLGFEDLGIVMFYPDDWSELIDGKWDLIKLMASDPTRCGWNTFVNRFIKLMMKHNPHISVLKTREHNEEVYVLRFKDIR